MAWLYHFNQIVTHGMEGFLETAVPLISGLAEIIGLFIIVTSLVKATYHYVRVTFFHGQRDFLHGHLCPAGHDEPDAPLGDGGRAPLRPQKGRNARR